MREENANAVETGSDGCRRAGWMVGLRVKGRRGSGVSVTFWQGQGVFPWTTATRLDLH